MSISSISGAIPQIPIPAASPASETAGKTGDFKNFLESAIGRVESSRAGAEQMAKDFISGDNEELHTVALATQRAELELDLTLQIRNKVVSAYQEIMRMQV